MSESDSPRALVLAETPERIRWRELSAELERRRDELADLELDLQETRRTLSDFEAQLELALADEQRAIEKIERVAAGLEQWTELIWRAANQNLVDAAREHEQRQRRQRRRRRRQRRQAALPELPETTDADLGGRLKRIFHRLARRYHPDLARDEAERLRHGRVMARIIDLYRAGDLARLEALLADAPAEEAPPELPAAIVELEARLASIQLGLDCLREEREVLGRSPTADLRERAQRSTAAGEDLFATLRVELRERATRSHADVAFLITTLEAEVQRYNRRQAGEIARARADRLSVFDPLSERRLVRLSREALDARQASPEARALARRLQDELRDEPHLLRLLLLTHVAELSPFPLGGVDSYAELERRYQSFFDDDAPPLTQSLVALEEWIEFGVRRATHEVVHAGLRFRHPEAQAATALALSSVPFRRELKRVLAVIGERLRCADCATEVFAVPLYRTRGLDDLRANVCPLCGATLASYFMPKGQDLQAVLNDAYREHGLIVELGFRLSRANLATQLVPVQLERLNVGQLKARLFTDLFARYHLPVEERQIVLLQRRRPVSDRTPLAELGEHAFGIRFDRAKLSEANAVELLRYRVRHRFSASEANSARPPPPSARKPDAALRAGRSRGGATRSARRPKR